MSILEVNGIMKIYTSRFGGNKVEALKNVIFQVEKGEYVAIMGPSGSGKTTLMNIIGCLDRPTSGTYILDGEDVFSYKDKAISDVRLHSIGFVFQSFHLLPRLSALDNVCLPLFYRNRGEKHCVPYLQADEDGG